VGDGGLQTQHIFFGFLPDFVGKASENVRADSTGLQAGDPAISGGARQTPS
jgi:hypothetical protein